MCVRFFCFVCATPTSLLFIIVLVTFLGLLFVFVLKVLLPFVLLFPVFYFILIPGKSRPIINTDYEQRHQLFTMENTLNCSIL